MKRFTIYLDEAVWQEFKAFAWKESIKAGKTVSTGSYLTMIHNLHKGNKSEVPEKIAETPKEETPKSTISTGGRPDKQKVIADLKETGRFNPQPKKG